MKILNILVLVSAAAALQMPVQAADDELKEVQTDMSEENKVLSLDEMLEDGGC